ncbi:MAG TPA: hypothetical protein PLZ52_01715 [Bacteroidales bacterium]|nr:hypothetical protein [Bacteroidales bacterium]
MKKLNEDLIKRVFDAMVKNRPALAKFVVVDEDDEDDAIDPRLLGDLIIRNFPWPVGVELRRLFSGSMRQLDRMRLDQIFKTIERSMQFMSFIMISQLWRDVANGLIMVPDSFKKDFESRFSVLSMGNYAWIIRMLTKFYSEQERDWFLPETVEFDSKFLNALDFWVPERNEIGHYQINLTQEDIEKRCVEYEDKLAFILEKLSFLVKYKLVSVREIKVVKPKNQDPVFQHSVDILNSSDSGFKIQEIDETKFTDTQSVLLMKSIKSIDEYLNLSPLIIDTNCEVINDKEKFDIKKDIFMFTKFRSDHLMYVGTEVTEKCDLRSLSNYANLLQEYKDLVKVVCG